MGKSREERRGGEEGRRGEGEKRRRGEGEDRSWEIYNRKVYG